MSNYNASDFINLPEHVLSCIVQYLSPKIVYLLSISSKSLYNGPICHLYCSAKGLKLDPDEDNWNHLVKRLIHVPNHINNSFLGKLADYEDDNSLRIKRRQWSNILSNWEKYSTKKRKDIKTLIIQGVPMSQRALFWKKCLSLDNFPPVNYSELISSNEWREDIPHFLNLDYPRFGACAKKSSYRNVLCALSAYDKEILYTPAMGILATMLLNYLTEEESFKALATLMGGKYKFKGMFAEGLPELHTQGRVFQSLFETLLPRIYAKCNLAVDHIISIPMLGIFTSLHPNIGMHRIWDLIMFDGYDIILCVLLALLDIHKEKFLNANEEQIFMSFIRLGSIEDVPRFSSTKNDDNNSENKIVEKKNTEKKNNNNIFSGQRKGGYGFEVVSIGETMRIDKLLEKICKYYKKVVVTIPLM